MAEERKQRSSSRKELFGTTYVDVPEFNPTGKLPLGKVVIGRMLALCKKISEGREEKCAL